MDERPTFSERNWDERIGGDFFYHSESKFERFWPGPYQHFGFGPEADKMATWKMGAYMSHAPDYIAALTSQSQPVLVEVQGTGRGGDKDGVRSHKFKARKLDALGQWNSKSEVTFWLWDDTAHEFVWTSYVSVRGMIARGFATQGLFDNARPYWALPVDVIKEHADTERLRERYG